jgi:hypothetical protein
VVDDERERRQRLEESRIVGQEKRLDKSQNNARNLCYFGLSLAAALALLHGPTSLAVTIAVVSVGGPASATVLSRVLDKWKS